MRIAALYDIHANMPALEAVLQEVRAIGVDQIVIGGDLIPGPMPRETVELLGNLAVPRHCIYGNGERAVLAQMAAPNPENVTYWGTTNGKAPPEGGKAVLQWTARELSPKRELLSVWPKTVRMYVDGLGEVLFCHATPRSELDIFTRLTPEDRILPAFDGIDADVVVCGHTHMQFDRTIGRYRVVNAGSVGMPFQQPPGAYWLLLDGNVHLKYTLYDTVAAAARVRMTSYPQAEEFASRHILNSPHESEVLASMTKFSISGEADWIKSD
jgi:predicted phosphodiesterase